MGACKVIRHKFAHSIIALYLTIQVMAFLPCNSQTFFNSPLELREAFNWAQEQLREAMTIWYIPHPDDEIIGMAGAIHRSQMDGRENIIIFLTRGGNSLTKFILGLSKEELEAARIRESLAALEVIGVSPTNVFVFTGPLTRATARQIMYTMHELFPQAAHRTTSIFDPHPDHKLAACALLSVAQEAAESIDVAFYRVYVYDFPYVSPVLRRGLHVFPERVLDLTRKRAAIAQLALEDTSQSRYGIARLSTPRLLTEAASDLYEYRDSWIPQCDFIYLHTLRVSIYQNFGVSLWLGPLCSNYKIGMGVVTYPSIHLELSFYSDLLRIGSWGWIYLGIGRQLGPNHAGNVFFAVGLPISDCLFADYEYHSTGNHVIRCGLLLRLGK